MHHNVGQPVAEHQREVQKEPREAILPRRAQEVHLNLPLVRQMAGHEVDDQIKRPEDPRRPGEHPLAAEGRRIQQDDGNDERVVGEQDDAEEVPRQALRRAGLQHAVLQEPHWPGQEPRTGDDVFVLKLPEGHRVCPPGGKGLLATDAVTSLRGPERKRLERPVGIGLVLHLAVARRAGLVTRRELGADPRRRLFCFGSTAGRRVSLKLKLLIFCRGQAVRSYARAEAEHAASYRGTLWDDWAQAERGLARCRRVIGNDRAQPAS
mmetsp:Transcript_9030/g.23597  ORF Transcript_9030/g.23597 Transcript_9030/m.23597 type:complete len:265 (+) Transcript_9030:1688-2482(+)